jgi:hypothetical protein
MIYNAPLMRIFPLLGLTFLACASSLAPIPAPWLGAPPEPPKKTRSGPIVHDGKTLTPPFAAIDSVSVSEARKEIAFSVRRGNYDLGLVAFEGGAIRWLPADAADEVDVQWAPRGNKISYTIRAAGGDVVRTLHIPTAAALNVDFPFGRVHSLQWDMPAERFTVVWSTPDASVRTEVLKYDGGDRRMVSPPRTKLDVIVDPFGPGAIVLRPSSMHYDERLPLVVWRDEDLFAWNESRAKLVQNARVALVVTKGELDPARVTETAWLDPNRVFTVGAKGEGVSIVADPAVPAGRYRIANRVVSVPPAVVQSFAAGFIAEELKRTHPTNGSSR